MNTNKYKTKTHNKISKKVNYFIIYFFSLGIVGLEPTAQGL